MSTETTPSVTESTRIKTDIKTIGAIIVAIALGVYAWANVKADIADHARQLTTIQVTLGADHDLLTGMVAVQKEQTRLLRALPSK